MKLIGADVVAKIKTVYESGAHGGHIPGVDAELLEYMQEMFQCNGDVVRRLNELLSHNGITVSDVREGCIEVKFTCESVESLRNLRDLNDSGELEKMLNEAFCSQFASKGLKSLKLVLGNEQFEQCSQTFAQWIPMTSEHREALLSSEECLMDKIAVNDDLLDKLCFCKRRRQAIEQATTHEQQVKKLIDIVSRRPDSAYTQLLNALKDTNQHEAADIISGGSKTATDIEPRRETQKKCEEEAWNNVDRDLEYLLNLIIKAELGYLDETFRPAFYSICVASRGVAMSLHNLREHYSVPISRTSVDEEVEHMEHTSEMFPSRTQQSIEWPVVLHDHPGELFLLKHLYISI